MLLPYAVTQMTSEGISSDDLRRRMTAEAVAPVLTALAAPECTLNGEYIVTGGGLLRRASAVEWETVALPAGVFADCCSAFRIARGKRLGFVLVASPVYMTNMLVRHTGKRLLESIWRGPRAPR